MSVYRRDQGFPAPENSQGNLAAPIPVFANRHLSTLLHSPIESGAAGGQIGPRTESFARALHHDRTNRIIPISSREDLDQLLSHGLRESVHFLRTIKRDRGNPFLDFIPRLYQFHCRIFSHIMEYPCPRPTHMVVRPYRAPAFSLKRFIRNVTSLGPDAARGCP